MSRKAQDAFLSQILFLVIMTDWYVNNCSPSYNLNSWFNDKYSFMRYDYLFNYYFTNHLDIKEIHVEARKIER